MVLIRSASAQDAAGIAAVQRESWLAAYEGIIARDTIEQVMPPDDDGTRVRQAFRARPWQSVIVAVAGEGPEPPGEVAGYAAFGPEVDVLGAPWPHPPTAAGRRGEVAELYALYVHPTRWSTGTGRALMERTLARTARAGYQHITLWVLEDNARARRFYERAGFAPDGTRNILERLDNIPELRYRRPLTPR